MSKEADKPAVGAVDDDQGKGERRRKRRSGLRIPSDNVPRASDPEIAAPVPEDPGLAVSVAVAFGGGSAPTQTEPSGAGTDEAAAQPPVDAPLRLPDEPGDGVPEAVSAAIHSAGDELDDELEPTEISDAIPISAEDDAVTGPLDVATGKAPSVGLGALAADDQVELPSGEASGDSVEIAFEDDDIAQQARSAGEMSEPAAAAPPPAPPPRAPTEPPPTPSEPSPPAPAEAPVPAAVSAPAAPPREARPARAVTMALSEEDLEEVMEAAALAEAEMAAERAVSAATARAATEPPVPAKPTVSEPPVPSPPAVESPAAQPPPMTSEPATPQMAAAGEPPTPPPATAFDDAPATEVQLEPGHDPTPLHADPAESGEILTDDLLEEVDDIAEPVDGGADFDTDRTPPPPIPPHEPRAAEAIAADADRTPPPPPEPTEAMDPEPATPPAPPPPKAKKPPPAPKAPAKPSPAAAKPRRRRGKPWFEEIFEEDYLRTLPFLTPQATQAEAQFVEESFGLEPGAHLLDVGCGYGRHAMELAARGYHVVALDASLPLLLRGADEAQRRGLDINFVHGDMRELTFDSQFDGAYCLFSTFGFFDDETNKKTAQNVARALKPGARLVIEVLNRDYLLGDLPSRVWWEGDGCVVLEEVDFNYFSSRIISNRSVVFDDGRQLEQEISIRAYSLHEFGKLLHAAGFRVIEISGSMVTRGRFFGNHSRDIIVVAERRAPNGN